MAQPHKWTSSPTCLFKSLLFSQFCRGLGSTDGQGQSLCPFLVASCYLSPTGKNIQKGRGKLGKSILLNNGSTPVWFRTKIIFNVPHWEICLMTKPSTSEKIRAFISISHLMVFGDVDSAALIDSLHNRFLLKRREYKDKQKIKRISLLLCVSLCLVQQKHQILAHALVWMAIDKRCILPTCTFILQYNKFYFQLLSFKTACLKMTWMKWTLK